MPILEREILNMRLQRFSTVGFTLLFGLLVVPNAFGQNQESKARVTVFGSYSLLNGDRDFTLPDTPPEPFRSEFVDGGKFGFRVTGDLNDYLAVEGSYSYGRNNLRITELDETPPEERGFGTTLNQFGGNVLFFFSPRENSVRPFVTAGVGVTRFSPTDAAKARALDTDEEFLDDPTIIDSSSEFSFNFGGGVEAKVSSRVGVRFDVRDHIIQIPRFGLQQTDPDPTGGGIFFPVDGSVHNIEISAGVVFYF